MSPSTILIFDGDCGFCTSAANAVVKHSVPPVTAVAWQLADLSQFGLTAAQTEQRVYLVTRNDVQGIRTYGGHLAFAQLLTLQHNRALKVLGIMLKYPPVSWFGALGYWLVARFRHRLPGGTPACSPNREDASNQRNSQ